MCALRHAGIGYIAYGMMFNGPEFLNKRTAVGLSDPVCARQHFRTIAEAFVKQHPQAIFAQVGVGVGLGVGVSFVAWGDVTKRVFHWTCCSGHSCKRGTLTRP